MGGHVVESVKIVLLSVAAAVVYGVAHDQVTARVCLEYFTVAHPDVAGHEPTVIGLYWGVVATWWVGLPLGIALALVVLLFALAMTAGGIGYLATSLGWIQVGPAFRDCIPPEHHAAFLFDGWAHWTSYLGGLLGGAWITRATSWQRERAAMAHLAPRAGPRSPRERESRAMHATFDRVRESRMWPWVVVAFGAAALVFSTVTMRTHLSEPDGIEMATYGFPVPWRRPSLASSCAYYSDPFALMLDLGAHVGALGLVVARVRRAVGGGDVPRAVVVVAAMPIACLVLVLGLVAWLDRIGGPLGDEWHVDSREIVWGPAALGGRGDLRR